MDRAARLVIQHARTAQLLGVDFVPVYRPGPDRPPPEPAPESRDPAPADAPTPRSRPPASAIEPKAPDPRTAAIATSAAPVAPARAAPAPSPSSPAPSADRCDDPAGALAALEARYRAEAPHRAFGTPHTTVVFGEGNPAARLMFIGEAPGAEEDRQGRPFCGPSGQMLDKWIGAMGLGRPDVYIANVLKVRPPGNATPTTEEARVSAPFLFEQIRIIGPEAIVTLGLPAARLLLETAMSMGELRGRWWSFTDPAGREVPVMPTYHPAFLLRAQTKENRAKVWSDLQQVMELLGLPRPAGR